MVCSVDNCTNFKTVNIEKYVDGMMGITIDISHEAQPDEKFSILRYANSLRGGMAETQFSVCLIRQVFTWGLESGYLVPVPPRFLTMSQSNTGLDRSKWSKPHIVTMSKL